jgi:hypothetical protein
MECVALHDRPEWLAACAALLNRQWPRSDAARCAHPAADGSALHLLRDALSLALSRSLYHSRKALEESCDACPTVLLLLLHPSTERGSSGSDGSELVACCR